jgi:hypothetical protein
MHLLLQLRRGHAGDLSQLRRRAGPAADPHPEVMMEKAPRRLPDRVDPNLTVYEPAVLPFGGTYTGIAEFTRFYDKVREYYDFSSWQLTDVVAERDIVFSASRVHIAKRNARMHIAERFRFRGTTLIEVRVFICDEQDGQP